jgi:hypothetical protein
MTAPQTANDEQDTIKALLGLAASGVAAEVVDGTAQEATYRWPQDWQRTVRDYARAAAGGSVDVRRQATDTTGGGR